MLCERRAYLNDGRVPRGDGTFDWVRTKAVPSGEVTIREPFARLDPQVCYWSALNPEALIIGPQRS
jgi:hypothetical protein